MNAAVQSKPSGAAVSDLHLFTNRTTVHHYITDIWNTAAECRLFVFNGDIFDFHWALQQGIPASVHAAREWIAELLETHPDTQFVFLLGNHDSIPDYQRTLDELARSHDNLTWHPEWYRRDSRMFLHGDVYHAGVTRAVLRAYRQQQNLRVGPSRLHQAMYRLLYQSRVPAALRRFVSRKTCARRILMYLQSELGPELADIRDIYFGHMHTPFSHFAYRDIHFHNTGAALMGMRLNIVRFDI